MYKSFFKKDLVRHDTLGGGFAYTHKSKSDKTLMWKFSSRILNAGTDSWHGEEKTMNKIEQKWIFAALKNWVEKGQQTTPIVKDNLVLAQK